MIDETMKTPTEELISRGTSYAHTILFADSDGETGTIVLKRRMNQGSQEQDFLFTITWKKRNENWQIVQEIVAVLSE